MAINPAIDDLDRCKIALQYLAELQSVGLAALLELLLERMDDAIGQGDAQLRQCTCAGAARPRVTSGPASRGVLTFLPGSRQTSPAAAPVVSEDRYAEDARPCSDA